VGDVVWHSEHGKGTVAHVNPDFTHKVRFKDGVERLFAGEDAQELKKSQYESATEESKTEVKRNFLRRKAAAKLEPTTYEEVLPELQMFQPECRVNHRRWGRGTVIELYNKGPSSFVKVRFKTGFKGKSNTRNIDPYGCQNMDLHVEQVEQEENTTASQVKSPQAWYKRMFAEPESNAEDDWMAVLDEKEERLRATEKALNKAKARGGVDVIRVAGLLELKNALTKTLIGNQISNAYTQHSEVLDQLRDKFTVQVEEQEELSVHAENEQQESMISLRRSSQISIFSTVSKCYTEDELEVDEIPGLWDEEEGPPDPMERRKLVHTFNAVCHLGNSFREAPPDPTPLINIKNRAIVCPSEPLAMAQIEKLIELEVPNDIFKRDCMVRNQATVDQHTYASSRGISSDDGFFQAVHTLETLATATAIEDIFNQVIKRTLRETMRNDYMELKALGNIFLELIEEPLEQLLPMVVWDAIETHKKNMKPKEKKLVNQKRAEEVTELMASHSDRLKIAGCELEAVLSEKEEHWWHVWLSWHHSDSVISRPGAVVTLPPIEHWMAQQRRLSGKEMKEFLTLVTDLQLKNKEIRTISRKGSGKDKFCNFYDFCQLIYDVDRETIRYETWNLATDGGKKESSVGVSIPVEPWKTIFIRRDEYRERKKKEELLGRRDSLSTTMSDRARNEQFEKTNAAPGIAPGRRKKGDRRQSDATSETGKSDGSRRSSLVSVSSVGSDGKEKKNRSTSLVSVSTDGTEQAGKVDAKGEAVPAVPPRNLGYMSSHHATVDSDEEDEDGMIKGIAGRLFSPNYDKKRGSLSSPRGSLSVVKEEPDEGGRAPSVSGWTSRLDTPPISKVGGENLSSLTEYASSIGGSRSGSSCSIYTLSDDEQEGEKEDTQFTFQNRMKAFIAMSKVHASKIDRPRRSNTCRDKYMLWGRPKPNQSVKHASSPPDVVLPSLVSGAPVNVSLSPSPPSSRPRHPGSKTKDGAIVRPRKLRDLKSIDASKSVKSPTGISGHAEEMKDNPQYRPLGLGDGGLARQLVREHRKNSQRKGSHRNSMGSHRNSLGNSSLSPRMDSLVSPRKDSGSGTYARTSFVGLV